MSINPELQEVIDTGSRPAPYFGARSANLPTPTAQIAPTPPNTGIFRTGTRVLRKRGHLLVAICLNNSYYSRPRIQRLVAAAASLSDEVTLFFTDGPAKHNYLAKGQTEDEALKQTRKQYKQLKRACDQAVQMASGNGVVFSYVEWQSVYTSPEFIAVYAELTRLYASNAQFRHDIRDATRQVLVRHVPGSASEEIVDIGVRYSLEELGLLMMYEHIARKKLSSRTDDPEFAYIYYMRWEILERLVHGVYDGRLRPHVGCVVMSVSDPLRDPPA